MRLRDENDVRFMTEALRLARRLPRRTWPNPPVGAVVVRDGEIIARGAHLGPGLDHAEAVALAEAGERARGATIYVTLEPCNHQGRTPACAPRIVAAGVKRVVFGIRDPNPRVAGGGLAHLRDAGVEVAFGIAAAECLELVWPFVATDAFARPFVLLKTAASLDGRFAPPPESDTAGRPFYLTGAESLAAVGRMRRWSDIVLVGSGTVTADAPRLDGRRVGPDAGCPAADPVAACADTRLAHAVDWAAPGRLVFCGPDSDPGRARAMAEAGAEIVDCDARDGRVDPAGLLARPWPHPFSRRGWSIVGRTSRRRGCWAGVRPGRSFPRISARRAAFSP